WWQVGFRPVNEWSPTVVLGVSALVVVLLLLAVVLLARTQRRTRDELAQTRAVQAELLARLEGLDRPQVGTHPDVSVAEFVITDVGQPAQSDEREPVAGRIEGRLFVDIVARETLVKAAS